MQERFRLSDDYLDALLESERPRLVRLCARICGDSQVAEDLAQETLVEAWRHRGRLHDPDGTDRWLSAIARNVCLRWNRQHSKIRAHLASPDPDRDLSAGSSLEQLPDDFDIDVELERGELAQLLDRALALLPPESRTILIQRYIEELPQAEVATRLGLTEPAVAMRLQRGKLRLRRILSDELRAEMSGYGVPEPEPEHWEQTRLWCPKCGAERLQGRYLDERNILELRCPRCCVRPDEVLVHTVSDRPTGFKGMRSYLSALGALVPAADQHYRSALTNQTVPCLQCGHRPRLIPGLQPGMAPYLECRYYFHVCCEGCGALSDTALAFVSLASIEGWQFWQSYRKIRMLPERDIAMEGVPAIMTAFESVDSSGRLEAIYARDSFRLLHMHTSAAG